MRWQSPTIRLPQTVPPPGCPGPIGLGRESPVGQCLRSLPTGLGKRPVSVCAGSAEVLSLPRSARLRPLRFGVAVRQDVRRQDGSVSCPCLGSRQRSVRTSPTAAVRRCHQAVAYFPACQSPSRSKRCDSAGQCLLPVSDRRDCHHGSVVSDRSPDWQGPTWNLRCRADCHRRATRRVDFSPCLGVRPTGDSTHRSLCLGLSTSLLSCLSPDRQVRLAGLASPVRPLPGVGGLPTGHVRPALPPVPDFPVRLTLFRTPGSCQL